MEEHELKNKLNAYIFYAGFAITLIVALFFHNADLFIVACLMITISAAFYSSGHIINNLLIKHSKVIEIMNGYTLSDDLLGARKRMGNYYLGVSVAYLKAKKDSNDSMAQLKTLLENITEPFEFSMAAREIDKRMVLEGLETKRKMKEIAISRIDEKSYQKANEARRELNIIESEINSIKDNGKAFEIVLRLKATAKSANEAEVTKLSSKNLEHMASMFSTSLNLDYEVLKGEALMRSLEEVL